MTHPRLSGRPAAFTLAELLVVTAIMLVAAGLLLSAGGYALEEANQVQCRHHLRGLGLALRFYADAHEGALPVSDVLDGPHPVLVRALAKYVDDPRAWYCPSETRLEASFAEENLKAGVIGYFYYACERATANRGVSTFLRWDVPWPQRLEVTMDPGTWVLSDRWFSGEPTAHRFVQKGVNYLTLGGDVRMVEESPRQVFR